MSIGKRVALSIGIVIVAGVAFGVYWHMSHRPKKQVAPSLAVVGVGLYVVRDQDTGLVHVTRIFPHSPAEKAGLVPGVILNTVGGVSVETKSIKEISALLRGPIGSKVVVELVDASGATNDVEITREQFVNKSKD